MNWRLYAIAAVIASLFAGALYVRHLQNERVKAKMETVTTKAELETTKETIRITDRTVKREARISQEAKRASIPILQAEGADTPVPPDVANAWAASIERLRNNDATSLPDNDTGSVAALPAP